MKVLDGKTGKNDKKLIFMRGLPGSGKSQVAKLLVGDGIIHSTDDFFMQNGEYIFDDEKVGEFHHFNFLSSVRSMQEGRSPVIIDNTNIIAEHCVDYIEAGKMYGYDITVVEPNNPWAFDIEELMKRNTHNVPRETLVEMLEQYEKPHIFKEKLGL